MSEPTRSRKAGLAVIAAAAVLLLTGLGTTGLWAPDEPRYAQIAEELRSGTHGPGGAVLLRLNGQPYTQKPPLYYWIAAALGAPGGRVSEALARLPSALAGVAMVWLTLQLGGRLFRGRPRAALWSALVLLTVFRFGHVARRVQLDVLLGALELAALYAFWRLFEVGGRAPGTRRWLWLLHGALGLAVLAKGPVGLLPVAVAAVFLAWERHRGDRTARRDIFPAWSWLVSLGPALVWLGGAAALAPAGFLEDSVSQNLFGRFFAGTSHARPIPYYLYQFPLDFLPWTLLWPLAFLVGRRVRRESSEEERRARRFLASWIGVFLVFFSISAGKRGLYLLPAFPAAALLCGASLDAAVHARGGVPAAVRGALAAAALALGAAGGIVAWRGGWLLVEGSGFALPASFGAALAIACGGAISLAIGLARRWPGGDAVLTGVFAGLVAVELSVFALAYPAFDDEKSPRAIALAAAEVAGPGGAVAVFDRTPLVGGIAYYSGRPVVPLSDAAAARRFVAEGGRAVIVLERRLDALRRAGDFEVRASSRSGRRTLVVATPTSARAP